MITWISPFETSFTVTRAHVAMDSAIHETQPACSRYILGLGLGVGLELRLRLGLVRFRVRIRVRVRVRV